ncbi:FAD-linked oxidoreductase [Janibacter hoylei PVAS-1]|uniref:FAD-linked oxidoreductase n=1 Tax=Janibacter hoylei PVAS-1 TaxID=1210046 RepID=K1DZH9_9MICO|nr:D-arabinono-1,4-lactone oxidase [Janibacter hoylei]EKA62015.1 FAD-linked oxidoreductase [Janibacter hoylei PVAS-1]RWU82559.1 FAD-linked oxidoreductase [Janibacter hoylei PVAS-1]
MTGRHSASWSNWAGNVTDSAAVLSPRTQDELVEMVHSSAAAGRRIRPVGSGHSFTPIAQAGDTRLSLRHLSGIVAADRATGHVRVLAGTPLRVLNRALDLLGLAMPNLGDIDAQTLAGATSTGTHGTGATLPGLSAGIVGLRLVTPDGASRWVDESDPELFGAARVGLGALGVVTEIELACLPAYRLRAVERPDSLDAVLPRIQEHFDAHRHFELYWFPGTRRVQTKANDLIADDVGEPLAPWRRRLDDELLSNTVFGAANRVLTAVPRAVLPFNAVAARALTERSYTAPSHEVFVTPRTVRFVESEYAVPREAVADVLTDLVAWVERHREPISFPVEVRVAAPDDMWLSTGYERANAYVAVHQYHRGDRRAYFAAFEEIVAAHAGRPHWGKLHGLGAEQLADLYPRHGDFVALRDRLDPERVLTNDYLDRVLGP